MNMRLASLVSSFVATAKKLLRIRRGGSGIEIESEDGITWKKTLELVGSLIKKAGRDEGLRAKLEGIRDGISRGYLTKENKGAIEAILYAPAAPTSQPSSQQSKVLWSDEDDVTAASRRSSQRLSEVGSEGQSPALL